MKRSFRFRCTHILCGLLRGILHAMEPKLQGILIGNFSETKTIKCFLMKITKPLIEVAKKYNDLLSNCTFYQLKMSSEINL